MADKKTFPYKSVIKWALVGVGMLSSYFFGQKLKNDNPLEQAIEQVIEAKTGLKVDLSPEIENLNE